MLVQFVNVLSVSIAAASVMLLVYGGWLVCLANARGCSSFKRAVAGLALYESLARYDVRRDWAEAHSVRTSAV